MTENGLHQPFTVAMHAEGMTTTQSSNAPQVEPVPFARVLVPYDGSEQSEAALAFGIALAKRGAGLDIVHVVDETPVLTESSTTVVVFDPTPLIDALDDEGRAIANAAAARAREAGVEARTRIMHDFPVEGIVKAADDAHDALIVLGTHGRSGLPRTFLGSTTEVVLRSTTTPVLAVHAEMKVPDRLFTSLVVAVDDSDPADAAVHVAADLARRTGAKAVLCSVVDVEDILEKAGTYAYDPTPFLDGMRDGAKDTLDRALAHGNFAAGTATTTIVEDHPAEGVIAEAERRKADCIVIGSHGRRGLRRLFLGSVAENVLRHSPVPVLIVRAHATPKP